MTADVDFLAGVTEQLGMPPLEDEERAAVLDLVRVVAHTTERPFGPLTAYVLGLAMGSGTDPAARTAQLRDAIAGLEAQADAG